MYLKFVLLLVYIIYVYYYNYYFKILKLIYNCDIYFMKIKCCKILGKDRNGFCLWNIKGLLF